LSYQVKIKVDGIKCGGCFSRINREVSKVDLEFYDIDHANHIITLYYDDKKDTYQEVMCNIENAGYKPTFLFITEE